MTEQHPTTTEPVVVDCAECAGVGWFPAGPEDTEDCTACNGYGQIVAEVVA